MPRNGQGQYNIPSAAGNPVVPLTPIATSWANPTLADIAAALTQSVSSDGQTAMTGPLNMANNKIVNLPNGTISTDSVNYGQVFTSPAFTGIPTAPTAAIGTSTTQLATTAFVGTAFSQLNVPYENSYNQAATFGATYFYNLMNQQVVYSTVAAANDTIVNLTGNNGASLSLATFMPANNAITGVFGITNGPIAYRVTSWQIDGVTTVPQFVNGNAITAGNSNAFDLYSFSVLRDALGAFKLLVNLTTYS